MVVSAASRSHPCKVRKGGAPILSGSGTERSKAWATRLRVASRLRKGALAPHYLFTRTACRKGVPPPPPPGLLESTRYGGGAAKIFEFKGLTRKILKTKEIGRPDPFPVQPYRYGVANGFLSQRLIWKFCEKGSEMRREILYPAVELPHASQRKACVGGLKACVVSAVSHPTLAKCARVGHPSCPGLI